MDEKKPAAQIPQSQQVTIVHAAPQEPPLPSPDFLAIIERRNQAMAKILEYAISSTHSGQWVDQNGRPWPTAAACEVMARRCAVSWKDVGTEKRASQDNKGSFYIYESRATFYLPGGFDSIETVGTCSSRDTFLGTETKAGRDLSDIDEGSVMKAAYSNMIVNGVTRLLGVRMLTWELLAKLGINQSSVQRIDYNAGAKGGGTSGSPDTVKIGRDKGKTLAEISDLSWLLGVYTKDLADPAKAKFKTANQKWLETIKAEMARRANSQAGTVPKTEASTPWERIKSLCAVAGITKPGEFTRSVTLKDHSSKMTEEDVVKVADAIDLQRQQAAGEAF